MCGVEPIDTLCYSGNRSFNMKCPSCGLHNPESAQLCDCGFDFRRGTVIVDKRASPEGSAAGATSAKVAITDVHVPFWSMVTFMVKWAIASIPALLILLLLGLVASALFGGVLYSLFRGAAER